MPFIQGEKQKSPQIFEDKAFSQKIVPFFTQLLLDLETWSIDFFHQAFPI